MLYLTKGIPFNIYILYLQPNIYSNISIHKTNIIKTTTYRLFVLFGIIIHSEYKALWPNKFVVPENIIWDGISVIIYFLVFLSAVTFRDKKVFV